MIDLHLHFDGSIPIDTVLELAKLEGVTLPTTKKEELKTYLQVPDDCGSLNEYLERFVLPLSVLQSQKALKKAMVDVIKDIAKEGILYAELRFAPQFHCQKGLTQEEVVIAAIDGMKEGIKETGVKAQLILCCMRDDKNQAENIETVELTAKYLGKGVCACDLAGAEAIFKTKDFKELFLYAKEKKVPYTIHAGEADDVSSMVAAISFGAKRLGHGVSAMDSEELMLQLKQEKIALECCPISNLHTKKIASMKEHPIKMFLNRGILTTINTDNRTASNTTIVKEVSMVREYLGLTKEEEQQLYLNAAEIAFLPEEEKEQLKNKIKEKFLL